MLRWTLAATAALALAGCGEKQAAQDSGQADQELARDNLSVNDLTAIDAASGADSNMAADIDFTNMTLNDGDERPSADRDSERRAPTARTAEPASDSADDERSNSTNETAPPEPEDGA